MRHSTSLSLITLILLVLSSLAWTPMDAIYERTRDEYSVGDQAADKKISLSIKADAALAGKKAKRFKGVARSRPF